MMKLDPDVDGKLSELPVCRSTSEDDDSKVSGRLLVGMAQAAPAKEAIVMRFFIV